MCCYPGRKRRVPGTDPPDDVLKERMVACCDLDHPVVLHLGCKRTEAVTAITNDGFLSLKVIILCSFKPDSRSEPSYREGQGMSSPTYFAERDARR